MLLDLAVTTRVVFNGESEILKMAAMHRGTVQPPVCDATTVDVSGGEGSVRSR